LKRITESGGWRSPQKIRNAFHSDSRVPSFGTPWTKRVCIGSLFLADNTVRGAVILATELRLFQENPESGTAAFPLPAKQSRLLYAPDAAVYIAGKAPYTHELAQGMLGQLLVIYSSAVILKVLARKSAAVASLRPFLKDVSHCIDAVSETLLREIPRIVDEDILREFAGGAVKLQVPDIVLPLEENFCQVFCHIWTILWSDVDVFNLVTRGVPDPFHGKLATICEAAMVKAPHLAIICVAIRNLVQFVFSSELVTKRRVVEFLITLSINYFEQTLSEIESAKLGAQVTASIFIVRTKRQATIAAVCGILKRCRLS
jgi:hypothetical protein